MVNSGFTFDARLRLTQRKSALRERRRKFLALHPEVIITPLELDDTGRVEVSVPDSVRAAYETLASALDTLETTYGDE